MQTTQHALSAAIFEGILLRQGQYKQGLHHIRKKEYSVAGLNIVILLQFYLLNHLNIVFIF